jgi:hypothetical protein
VLGDLLGDLLGDALGDLLGLVVGDEDAETPSTMMNARIEVLKSIAMACLVLGRINGY